MTKTKRKHSASFKGQIALEALKEQQSIPQLSSQRGVHPTQIRQWRDLLKSEIPNIFTKGVNHQLAEKDQLIDRLYKQVGQLTVESEWLKKKLGLNDS
jgi:transposase-like protein